MKQDEEKDRAELVPRFARNNSHPLFVDDFLNFVKHLSMTYD